MENKNEQPRKECPNCGAKENQIRMGYNRSGTQSCKCKDCGVTYTINPKQREYSDEVKEQAIKAYYSGVSGRGVGRFFGMNKSNVYHWIKKKETNCE